MSVHISQRNESAMEYIASFLKFQDYAENKISNIPKRKFRWIGKPIIDKMNEIYEGLFVLNKNYYRYGITAKKDKEAAQSVIDKYKELNRLLFIFWNINKDTMNDMRKWAVLADKAIDSLIKISGFNRRSRYMDILDYESINKAKYVKKMTELHSFIYSKTISTPKFLRESKGTELMKLGDTALLCVIDANRFPPDTKEEYLQRKENISTALDCVNTMQIPIVSLFYEMKYNESTMKEWARLVNDELNLLKAVQKSDNDRFGHLLLE